MAIHQHLSSEGSDRATAYSMSSKIVRRGDQLFTGWLDAPGKKGTPARIMMGVCDGKTGALQKTIQLGAGKDNHCGPAFALDGNGRLHGLIGAHHDPFLYRWSDDPADEKSWSEPEPLGPKDTYPSLIVDRGGALHVAYREYGERWQLQYRRKKTDGPWEAPRSMAISPTPGYNHFMHDLSAGPTGTLHLTFQFHYSDTGRAQDCKGKGAAHLQSDDGGDTWWNGGTVCDFPLTIETARMFAAGYEDPDYNLRIGNHVVDRDNNPWLFASMPDPPRGVVWRRTESGWETVELADSLPHVNLAGGKSTAVSYDAGGRVHIMVSAHPGGKEAGWYDPVNEVFYVVLNADGSVACVDQVTESNPEAAHWLPALEKWDWTRPGCSDGHWFMYTSGINAGLISQTDYNSALKTDVYLGKRPLEGFKT